jgi:hypothetical protein
LVVTVAALYLSFAFGIASLHLKRSRQSLLYLK